MNVSISFGQGFGIGVSSPANTLDVEGNMAIGASYSGTSAAPANGLIVEGNVGIGNTAGSEPLHVTADAGHDNIRLQENSGIEYWNLSIDVNGDLHFEDDGIERITFEDGGQVGIGTSAPEDPLHIVSDAGGDAIHLEEAAGGDGEDWQIGVDATGDLNFEDSGGSGEMTFEDGGDVGIGTASPSHGLHIVDDDATANRAGLYADASGAAAGTNYAGYFVKTGASTTNIAGYFNASGATDNYAITTPDDGGFVGIGLLTPTCQIDIREDDANNSSIVDIMGLIHSTSIAAGIGIGVSFIFRIEDDGGDELEGASIDVLYVDATDGSENASMAFYVDVAGVSREILRLDGTLGYVGIDQATPRTKLDVIASNTSGSVVSDAVILSHELDGLSAATTGLGAGLAFFIEDGGDTEEQGTIDIILDDITNTVEDAVTVFKLNQAGAMTEMLRIDGTETGGRVGIGETNPAAKLDIETSIASETGLEITQSATSGTNYGLLATNVGAATTNIGGYFAATGATNNYALVVPASGGYVGIGTASPLDVLHVKAAADNHCIRFTETGIGSEFWVVGVDGGGDVNFENDDGNIYLTLGDGGQIGVGSGATSPAASLDLDGSLALRVNTVTLSDGDNDDVVPGNFSFMRIDGPTAAFAITGISGGVDGRVLALFSTVSDQLTIKDDDASSAAGNRIYCGSGVDRTVEQYALIYLIYSSTDSRWIMQSAF